MRKLLSLVVGQVKTLLRRDPAPDDPPRYGSSVSYTACPDCGEGALTYDEDVETTVCNVCGARPDEDRTTG